jgi:hypothetical protein
MRNPDLLFIGTLLLTTSFIVILKPTYAHVYLDEVQFWEDPQDNLEIEFGYVPEEPVIDTFTNLSFSITEWETDEHIKDSLAMVTITMGERIFKFQNITVPNGDFSVEYLFPEHGTHQVLLRLDRNDSIHVASFQVYVPHQSTPEGLSDLHNVIISLGILIAITGTTIVLLKRR